MEEIDGSPGRTRNDSERYLLVFHSPGFNFTKRSHG